MTCGDGSYQHEMPELTNAVSQLQSTSDDCVVVTHRSNERQELSIYALIPRETRTSIR